MALGRIKRSGGVMQGQGMTIAGLILGYIFTAVYVIISLFLAAAGFAAATSALTKARTLVTATALESAVNNYMTEYGTMPSEGLSDTTLTTSADTSLLEVLLGLEDKLNMRSIKFLSVREGSDKKNGLVYSSNDRSVVGLFDPWGGGYKVRLNLDSDGNM